MSLRRANEVRIEIMKSLEQFQKQLDGLHELRNIVKTMKSVSAASIRQYEQAAASLAGYTHCVELSLCAVMKSLDRPRASARLSARPGSSAAIVFGSDHGLCGHFNEGIAEHTRATLETSADANPKPRILAVGARVAASLERLDLSVVDTFSVPGSAAQITATGQRLLLIVDEWQRHDGVEVVDLYHNVRARGSQFQPTHTRLLPIESGMLDRLRKRPWPSRRVPCHSMGAQPLLGQILHHFFSVAIFRACAESSASEHASRLAAMQAAERNLDERLTEVTMQFRRARQEVVTSELLDVVSGFEAMTGRPR